MMGKIEEALRLLHRAAVDNEAPTGAETLAAEAVMELQDLLSKGDYEVKTRLLAKRTRALVEITKMHGKFIQGKTRNQALYKSMKEKAREALK